MVELLLPTIQVHVALLDHQLHIPQPAKPAAGLSQLHIIWRIFTHQHVHKTVKQPLPFGTMSDVANNRYHNEIDEGEISRFIYPRHG